MHLNLRFPKPRETFRALSSGELIDLVINKCDTTDVGIGVRSIPYQDESNTCLQFRQRIPPFSYFTARRQNDRGGSASDQVRLHLQRLREVKRPSSGAERGLRDAEMSQWRTVTVVWKICHWNSTLDARGSFYWGHYLYNSSLDAHQLLHTSPSIRCASFGAVSFFYLLWNFTLSNLSGTAFNFSTSIIFTQRRSILRPYVVFRYFFHLTKRKRARPPTRLERNPIFQATPPPIWL